MILITSFIKINNKTACSSLKYDDLRSILEFKVHYLEKGTDMYHYGRITNIYIAYELSLDTNKHEFTLENCLFESVAVRKNNDIDKYEYMDVVLVLIQENVFCFLMVVLRKM